MLDWRLQLSASAGLSLLSYLVTCRAISGLGAMFVRAGLCGVDMGKQDRRKLPEAIGLICGCVYLIALFLFIPVPFGSYLVFNQHGFPHEKFVQLLAALLSICCMLLLGFGDDVLELKWRHKLWLPSVATLPLLVVYYVTFNWTLIIVPKPLRWLLGHSLDLGPLYYLYMGLLSVFCTNAINILSGVNGLEVGQAVVVALSLAAHNGVEIASASSAAETSSAHRETHLFSLYMLLPFIGVSLALLKHNWYPARVFVGDTYCYFAGMTFAVIGILGHFSKTMLLFFLPQIANFVYSLPQLLHVLPCPRHRLPRYDAQLDRLTMSTASVRLASLSPLARATLRLTAALRLAQVSSHLTAGDPGHGRSRDHSGAEADVDSQVTFNNMTLVNLLLSWTGPLHERTVTTALLVLQVMCSCLAFIIRYPLASLFYDVTQ